MDNNQNNLKQAAARKGANIARKAATKRMLKNVAGGLLFKLKAALIAFVIKIALVALALFFLIFFVKTILTAAFIDSTETHSTAQNWSNTQLMSDVEDDGVAKGVDAFYKSFYEEVAKTKYAFIREIKEKNANGEPISYKEEKETDENISDFEEFDKNFKVPASLYLSLDKFVLGDNNMFPQWFAQPISEDDDYENAGINTKFIYEEDVKYEKVVAAFTQQEVCVASPSGGYRAELRRIEDAEDFEFKLEGTDIKIHKMAEARTFVADFVNSYDRADSYYRDLKDEVGPKLSDARLYHYDDCVWTETKTKANGDTFEVEYSIPLHKVKEGAVMMNQPFLTNTQKTNERKDYIYDYLANFTAKQEEKFLDQIKKIEKEYYEKEEEFIRGNETDEETTFEVNVRQGTENAYNFNIGDLGEKSGIKTVEEMRQVIRTGCAQEHIKTPLEDHAELLLKLEEEHKVNALFMVALAKTETNCGRDGVGRSKKNMYAYGGGGQKSYSTYEKAITTAIEGIGRNYISADGQYHNGSPGLCSMTGIYCQEGCNSWIPGILGAIERIGVNNSINDICYINNHFTLSQELLDLAKEKVKIETFTKYYNIEHRVTERDVDAILIYAKAFAEAVTFSEAEEDFLMFFDEAFDPNLLNANYFIFNIYNQISRDFEIVEENLAYIIIDTGEVFAINDAEVTEKTDQKIVFKLDDDSVLTLEGLETSLKKGDRVNRGDLVGRGTVKISLRGGNGEVKNAKSLLLDSFNLEGQRAIIVQAAQKLIGRPYVWGAKGPLAFDCSGFTYHIYKLAGITIPHGTMDQRNTGARINNISDLRPGDMVHFNSAGSATGRHVGMFLGFENGEPIMIHAGSSRTGVVKGGMN